MSNNKPPALVDFEKMMVSIKRDKARDRKIVRESSAHDRYLRSVWRRKETPN